MRLVPKKIGPWRSIPNVGGTLMRIAAATAAFSLLLASPVLADPQPAVPADMGLLMVWITSASHWTECGRETPPFGFNGVDYQDPKTGVRAPFRCFEAGPFTGSDSNNVSSNQWYVQLVYNLTPTDPKTGRWQDAKTCSQSPDHPCFDSFIRVCNFMYVLPPNQIRKRNVSGPCRSTAGIGGKGCEVCAATEDFVGRKVPAQS
jgi:hypothetical protein